MGCSWASRAWRTAHETRRPSRSQHRNSCPARNHGQRLVAAFTPSRSHASRSHEHSLLRRLGNQPLGTRKIRNPRPHQQYFLGPIGRMRTDHPLERAPNARYLENRPSAGRRRHRGAQASRMDPAERIILRRPHQAGGHSRWRLQRCSGLWSRSRRRTGCAHRHCPHLVHRLGADCQGDCQGGRRQPNPAFVRARWQEPAVGFRGC